MGALNFTEFFVDGQQIIDRVKVLTETALKEAKCFPICPVQILITDF